MDTVPLRERQKLLRAFRKQYGITLTELGKLSVLSQPMLSQFERGERNLSAGAWARVLVAMSRLLREDTAKGAGEIADDNAKRSASELRETAEKLDVFNLGDMLSGEGPYGFLTLSDETIAKEKTEVDAESLRLAEQSKLSNLIDVDLDTTIKEPDAEAIKREDVPALLQTVKDLYTTIRTHNQRMADLAAKGYVVLPKVVEEERDRFRARVEELEKELERERATKGEVAE